MKTPIQFDKVADIYDLYVKEYFDIAFFKKETENFYGEILELMCGTGRVSIPLLKSNRKMTCVDYSKGMLAAFDKKIRGQGYAVELIEMDVVNLELHKKYDLIILPFHSLSEITSYENQQKALERIGVHLTGGGTFICTLQNPNVRLQTADGTTKILGKFPIDDEREMILSHMNQVETDGMVTGYQFYEIYDSMNILIEKRYLEINFRPIYYTEFNEMIQKAGLKAENVYGDYSYGEFDEETSNFMIFKLKKS
ncbi:MAG: class I SAM-dependent methyltransferase [bacterium]|nr:class I SAM-dependent methyltransferase [bacterium]